VLLVSGASVIHAQVDWQGEFESLRRTVEGQQLTIEQQAELLADQQGRLDTLESSDVEPPAGEEVGGYDGGFVLSDGGGSDSKFRMRIGSWGQVRYNLLDSQGSNLDQNSFDLERLRLAFNGHAFNSSFQYFFQLDGDSDGGEVVDFLDYYVTYDFGRDLFCFEKGKLALRFGKWKIGFNRAREESGTRMQFSDRATASVLFDFDRSLGVGVLGEVGPFEWQVAVANGIDTGGFRTTLPGDLDGNLAIATRVNWLVSGDWGKDGHADLDYRSVPAIRLGMGFTRTRHDVAGAREFGFPRAVDSGAKINTVLPAGVTAYDLSMYATDLNVKYCGFSFIYEYYFRNLTDFSGGTVSDLFDHGYWAEVGYFIVPEQLQLIARHSRIVGNSGTLGMFDHSADEVAGGFVTYMKGHNLKLTFDVTHLNGAPVSDSALNIRPGDDGWLYRTQFQWKF